MIPAELVNLDDFRKVVRGTGLEQAFANGAPHLDECGNQMTGPLWINRGVITGYHPALLEAPDALGDRG